MSEIKSNPFLESVLSEIPRLLGQLNRNPSSHTFGSFDRAYWHYRTNDISSCRYQEAVYTLALLYCSQFEGNEYYHDSQVLKWIRSSLSFSASIQRPNGSFDEWYINEGSYVGTAFLAAALSQTVLLLRSSNIVIVEDSLICKTIERAARFLIKQDEKTVMNQVAGAIFAIAAAGHVCNKEDLTVHASNLLDKFLLTQNQEGWWNEYGGPDIGYLSLTINYLKKYQKLTSENKINAAVERAKKFLEQFINPDHTAGGEYMSRNTEYIIPSVTLPYLGAVGPAHLDDRYLCYILYNWIEVGLQVAPQIHEPSFGENYFPESSILRVANERYFLVANGKKGGSFRLYAGGKVYYDSGLEIVYSHGNLSTGILDSTNEVFFQEGSLRIIGLAKRIREPLLETKIAIVFKLWQFIFGRAPLFQKVIKNFLRLRMVSYSSGVDVSFERKFEYHPQEVVITDIIRASVARNAILFGVKASYNAVPSSKYAAMPEIDSRRLMPRLEEKKDGDTYIIKRVFSFQ